MHRRPLLRGLGAALVLGPGLWPAAHAVTPGEATTGIRAALERGAVSAVALLGRPDGFLGNPQVRIALPRALEQAAGLLAMVGQQHRVEELVTAMNRAAEAAVPQAQPLLVAAAKSMTVEDALGIVRGGETSVTQFFATRTRQPLFERFLPIVTRTLEQASLVQRYNELLNKAGASGLASREEARLEPHVTAKALDGLYFMIGEEERRIRRDPVGTGSAILQKVFGLR